MKTLTFVLYVIVGLSQVQFAGAVAFRFDEPLGPHPQLMYVNFGEACFLQSGKRYEHATNLSDCFAGGGDVQPYADEPTRSLADHCSKLNVLKYLTGYRDDVQSFTFSKLVWELDGEDVASARAACGELARLFAAMPFDAYGKTVKDCRRMVGTTDDCVRLLRTGAGVVVGFFFFESASDVQSQCETLKARQAQPPNLICTLPWQRVGPDLRFRTTTELSKCPPLEPPSVPPSCTDPKKPDTNNDPSCSEPKTPDTNEEAPPDTNEEAKP
jgi:hypothetical protein